MSKFVIKRLAEPDALYENSSKYSSIQNKSGYKRSVVCLVVRSFVRSFGRSVGRSDPT